MDTLNSISNWVNKPISINSQLVWDYDIPPLSKQSTAFKQWYITRVLTRGCTTDIKAIGVELIYYYFPVLNLPLEIYEFWQWYFNLPEIKAKYGYINPLTT